MTTNTKWDNGDALITITERNSAHIQVEYREYIFVPLIIHIMVDFTHTFSRTFEVFSVIGLRFVVVREVLRCAIFSIFSTRILAED